MPSDNRTSLRVRSAEPFMAMFGSELSDALLLGRYVDHWDHAAFRVLVDRHGPMVLAVCRRVLRDPHTADDAFQATFILLVRKAGSVRKRGSVGPWLYGVAHRVALEARAAASRRQMAVVRDPEVPGTDDDGLEREELYAALHEELGRLPEKYRAPLVLCYMQGLPHESVARELGWRIGTVRGRIARGRELLGARLIRRGLKPTAVLLALSLLPEAAAAPVPLRLVEATVTAAARVAAGANQDGPRGDVPLRVAHLEAKARKAMHLTQLKWAATLTLAFVVTGTGVAALLPRALAAVDETAKAQAERKKLQGTWLPISGEEGGQKQELNNGERMVIDGNTFALMKGDDEVAVKGPFTLDPSKDPMQMDIVFEEGKRKGQTGLAIYAWDGENLKFCAAPDTKGRPTDFTTAPGDDRILILLKRKSP